MSDIIAGLTDRDDKAAYAYSQQIAAESENSPAYYTHLDEFSSLLNDRSSYVRTRGFVLCCCQARWDTEGKIGALLPKMLKLLHDPKPTVVRQCLNALKDVIRFLPSLCGTIREELENIDLSQYRDSMSPLIRNDIASLQSLMENSEKMEKK